MSDMESVEQRLTSMEQQLAHLVGLAEYLTDRDRIDEEAERRASIHEQVHWRDLEFLSKLMFEEMALIQGLPDGPVKSSALQCWRSRWGHKQA